MLFIFVLLYISIATILQLGHQTKRLLKNVVIIALLINFSMFFTEVIIDTSNAVAIAFHNASMNISSVPDDATLSKAFLHTAEITSFLDTQDGKALHKMAGDDIGSIVSLAFVAGIFIIVTSFVLLAGAFFLITRLIMFILLIILSPLAFVANILPQTSHMFQSWLKSLTSNAFFAPMFLALVFASLTVLDGASATLGGIPDDEGLATAAQGVIDSDGTSSLSEHTGAILFRTILAMGMLFASLIIAKTLSIKGGATADQMARKWSRAAGMGVVRGTGRTVSRTARGTIGRAASRRADNDELKRKASEGGAKGRFAQMQLAASEKLSGSKFGGGSKVASYKEVEQRKINRHKQAAERLKTSPRMKEELQTELDAAKASGDKQRLKDAQSKYDQHMGVSDEEAKKRVSDIQEKARKAQEAKQRMRKKNNQPLLTREESKIERQEFERKLRKNAENKGMTFKKTKSADETRKEEYVKNNIKDVDVGFNTGITKDNVKKVKLKDRAYIREALGGLKKDKKDKKNKSGVKHGITGNTPKPENSPKTDNKPQSNIQTESGYNKRTSEDQKEREQILKETGKGLDK